MGLAVKYAQRQNARRNNNFTRYTGFCCYVFGHAKLDGLGGRIRGVRIWRIDVRAGSRYRVEAIFAMVYLPVFVVSVPSFF